MFGALVPRVMQVQAMLYLCEEPASTLRSMLLETTPISRMHNACSQFTNKTRKLDVPHRRSTQSHYPPLEPFSSAQFHPPLPFLTSSLLPLSHAPPVLHHTTNLRFFSLPLLLPLQIFLKRFVPLLRNPSLNMTLPCRLSCTFYRVLLRCGVLQLKPE